MRLEEARRQANNLFIDKRKYQFSFLFLNNSSLTSNKKPTNFRGRRCEKFSCWEKSRFQDRPRLVNVELFDWLPN